jgi:hypothetical protein
MSLKPSLEQPFTLVVNSTDNYSDCWQPFFTLLDRYWPELQSPVILNSETLEFKGDSAKKVINSRSACLTPGRRPTWTESINHALSLAPTDLIVYVQEDYFLHAPVQHETLLSLANVMQQRKMTFLSLVTFGNSGPFAPSGFDERLWQVDQHDLYRISLQACLFSKSALARYFRRHEDPWMFEFYGNKRAHKVPDSFYTLNREMFAGKPIIPYKPTGVQLKKWRQDVVVDLFSREGIPMDYSHRDFYRGELPVKPLSVQRVLSTLKSILSIL